MDKVDRSKLIDPENKQKLTLEEVKYKSSKLHPHIEILQDFYENDKARFPVRCNKCGHVFETTWNNLRQMNGCARCANEKRKMSQLEFDTRMAKTCPWFEVLEPYQGAQTKIHVRCKKEGCGYIYSSTPVNLWKGPRCKKCRQRGDLK